MKSTTWIEMVTGRFGNVPFANVLCRSAKKQNKDWQRMYMLRSLSHDTKKCDNACICLVLSATDQAKALRELTQHANRTLAK